MEIDGCEVDEEEDDLDHDDDMKMKANELQYLRGVNLEGKH